MPRVTYADRLSALSKKPLSDYDKGFVESLAQHYNRKRSLTPGRAAAVRRLEERYSDEKLALAAANPINERLAAIADRVDPGTWDAGFVESLTSQSTAANTWKQTYLDSTEMQEKAKIVATYYDATGYYAGLAHNVLYTEGFVPTEKQYKSITKNKFATKILEAWYAEPKYPVGSYVVVRDTAPGVVRGKAKNVPCVILKANAMYPRCAAKGTKIYQVLPFGSPSAIMVEERYVKRARKLGGGA